MASKRKAKEILLNGLPLDRECRDCGGYGVIQHPAWAAWWARHPERPTEAAADDPEPQADEEIECPKCRGEGFELTEQGRLLLLWLYRHARGFVHITAKETTRVEPSAS